MLQFTRENIDFWLLVCFFFFNNSKLKILIDLQQILQISLIEMYLIILYLFLRNVIIIP